MEEMNDALIIASKGIGIVFLSLSLLVLLLLVLGRIGRRKEASTPDETTPPEGGEMTAEEPQPKQATPTESASGPDGTTAEASIAELEEVAVAAAALAVAWNLWPEPNGHGGPTRVTPARMTPVRAEAARPWRAQGRRWLMQSQGMTRRAWRR